MSVPKLEFEIQETDRGENGRSNPLNLDLADRAPFAMREILPNSFVKTSIILLVSLYGR